MLQVGQARAGFFQMFEESPPRAKVDQTPAARRPPLQEEVGAVRNPMLLVKGRVEALQGGSLETAQVTLELPEVSLGWQVQFV